MDNIVLNGKDELIYYYEIELAYARKEKERLIKEQNFAHAAVCRDIERAIRLKMDERYKEIAKERHIWDT